MFYGILKHYIFICGYFFIDFFVLLETPAAQPNYPDIGKSCPEFILSDIQNYPVKKISVKAFKGKPFILDFFTFGCTSCFESFPKIDGLKKILGDSLDIILVGKEDKGIRTQFDKFKSRYNLNLPVCYTASIFGRLGIVQVPYVLWVNKNGIIKAISSCTDLNSENIRRFLKDEPFDFVDRSHRAGIARDLAYDWRKPLLIHDNGGNDTTFLSRSVLSAWNPGLPQIIPAFVSNTAYTTYGYMTHNRFQATGIWLTHLYQLAYGDTLWQTPSLDLSNSYGKYANRPELLVQDTSAFQPDFKTGKGLYCYGMCLPPWKSTTKDMQLMMQRDLENYFGYQVRVVEKPAICWVIRADSSAEIKLETKGGSPHFLDHDRTEIKFVNAPMKALAIQLYISHYYDGPFIDETGISYNIDLHLKVFPDDNLDKIAIALKDVGLILFKTTRKLKVIEIRNPQV